MSKNNAILIVTIVLAAIIVGGVALWYSTNDDKTNTTTVPTNQYSAPAADTPAVFSDVCDTFTESSKLYKCTREDKEYYILQDSAEPASQPWYVYTDSGILDVSCGEGAGEDERCAEYNTTECSDVSAQCLSDNLFADYPLVTIGEINRAETDYGYYSLTAVVKEVVPCPVCPEGLVCEPCLGDYIVLSHVDDVSEDTFTELVVFFSGAVPTVTAGEAYDFVVDLSGPIVPVSSQADSFGRLINLVTFASAE